MILSTKQHFFTFALFLLLPLITLNAQETDTSTRSGNELCIMTFNIRVGVDRTPNSWPERRPLIQETIEMFSPDVIGTQEGRYNQIKDMATDLPDYDWIGLGRNGGSRDEFVAIFYLKERFEAVQFDHFWLSDTPYLIGSSTWGNAYLRMVTWVQLRDRESGQEFYYFNTHLDNESQESREKAAMLIRDSIDELQTDLPIILAGDFNSNAGSNKVYDILVDESGFTDTWVSAKERRSKAFKTIHRWEGEIEVDERIDWILTRGSLVTEASQIITYSRDDHYPSDHFPVISWMNFATD